MLIPNPPHSNTDYMKTIHRVALILAAAAAPLTVSSCGGGGGSYTPEEIVEFNVSGDQIKISNWFAANTVITFGQKERNFKTYGTRYLNSTVSIGDVTFEATVYHKALDAATDRREATITMILHSTTASGPALGLKDVSTLAAKTPTIQFTFDQDEVHELSGGTVISTNGAVVKIETWADTYFGGVRQFL